MPDAVPPANTDNTTSTSTLQLDALPLFPLQLVLFPGAQLALKIFEARYLDLVSNCMRQGQPFGVVCLRAGHEAGHAAGHTTDSKADAPIEEPARPGRWGWAGSR